MPLCPCKLRSAASAAGMSPTDSAALFCKLAPLEMGRTFLNKGAYAFDVIVRYSKLTL